MAQKKGKARKGILLTCPHRGCGKRSTYRTNVKQAKASTVRLNCVTCKKPFYGMLKGRTKTLTPKEYKQREKASKAAQ